MKATSKQIEQIESLYYSKEQTQEIEDMITLYLSDGYDNISSKEAEYIINRLQA